MAGNSAINMFATHESPSNARNLSSLDFSNRGITRISGSREVVLGEDGDRRIENIPATLESLNLSRNSLSSLEYLHTFPRLTSIDLSSNNIADPSPLQLCQSLTSVDLSDNSLKDFTGLSGCSRLKYLNVSFNDIKEMDSAEFEGLPALEKLNVAHNQLTVLEGIECLPSLRVLTLSHNKITDINITEPIQSVETLILDHNKLSSVEKFHVFLSVIDVILDANNITSYSSLDVFQGIRRLSARFNQIKDEDYVQQARSGSISDEANEAGLHLAHVEELNLSGNQITSLNGVLSGCPKLRAVYLSDNRIESPGLQPLANTEVITFIDLSNNSIEDCSFLSEFPNIHIVLLTNNRIDDMMQVVRTFSTSSIATAGAGAGPVRPPPPLRHLDLRGNPITGNGLYPDAPRGRAASDIQPYSSFDAYESFVRSQATAAGGLAVSDDLPFLSRLYYRCLMLHHIPTLTVLDHIVVSGSERHIADAMAKAFDYGIHNTGFSETMKMRELKKKIPADLLSKITHSHSQPQPHAEPGYHGHGDGDEEDKQKKGKSRRGKDKKDKVKVKSDWVDADDVDFGYGQGYGKEKVRDAAGPLDENSRVSIDFKQFLQTLYASNVAEREKVLEEKDYSESESSSSTDSTYSPSSSASESYISSASESASSSSCSCSCSSCVSDGSCSSCDRDCECGHGKKREHRVHIRDRDHKAPPFASDLSSDIAEIATNAYQTAFAHGRDAVAEEPQPQPQPQPRAAGELDDLAEYGAPFARALVEEARSDLRAVENESKHALDKYRARLHDLQERINAEQNKLESDSQTQTHSTTTSTSSLTSSDSGDGDGATENENENLINRLLERGSELVQESQRVLDAAAMLEQIEERNRKDKGKDKGAGEGKNVSSGTQTQERMVEARPRLPDPMYASMGVGPDDRTDKVKEKEKEKEREDVEDEDEIDILDTSDPLDAYLARIRQEYKQKREKIMHQLYAKQDEGESEEIPMTAEYRSLRAAELRRIARALSELEAAADSANADTRRSYHPRRARAHPASRTIDIEELEEASEKRIKSKLKSLEDEILDKLRTKSDDDIAAAQKEERLVRARQKIGSMYSHGYGGLGDEDRSGMNLALEKAFYQDAVLRDAKNRLRRKGKGSRSGKGRDHEEKERVRSKSKSKSRSRSKRKESAKVVKSENVPVPVAAEEEKSVRTSVPVEPETIDSNTQTLHRDVAISEEPGLRAQTVDTTETTAPGKSKLQQRGGVSFWVTTGPGDSTILHETTAADDVNANAESDVPTHEDSVPASKIFPFHYFFDPKQKATEAEEAAAREAVDAARLRRLAEKSEARRMAALSHAWSNTLSHTDRDADVHATATQTHAQRVGKSRSTKGSGKYGRRVKSSKNLTHPVAPAMHEHDYRYCYVCSHPHPHADTHTHTHTTHQTDKSKYEYEKRSRPVQHRPRQYFAENTTDTTANPRRYGRGDRRSETETADDVFLSNELAKSIALVDELDRSAHIGHLNMNMNMDSSNVNSNANASGFQSNASASTSVSASTSEPRFGIPTPEKGSIEAVSLAMNESELRGREDGVKEKDPVVERTAAAYRLMGLARIPPPGPPAAPQVCDIRELAPDHPDFAAVKRLISAENDLSFKWNATMHYASKAYCRQTHSTFVSLDRYQNEDGASVHLAFIGGSSRQLDTLLRGGGWVTDMDKDYEGSDMPCIACTSLSKTIEINRTSSTSGTGSGRFLIALIKPGRRFKKNVTWTQYVKSLTLPDIKNKLKDDIEEARSAHDSSIEFDAATLDDDTKKLGHTDANAGPLPHGSTLILLEPERILPCYLIDCGLKY